VKNYPENTNDVTNISIGGDTTLNVSERAI